MALRKRSYKKDHLISTFLHNSKVDAHKRRLKEDEEKKRRGRERAREQRAQEQVQDRLDGVEKRLKASDIDIRWTKQAMKIMDDRSYGLNQFRTKVLPELIPIIKTTERREAEIAKEIKPAQFEIIPLREQIFSEISDDLNKLLLVFDGKKVSRKSIDKEVANLKTVTIWQKRIRGAYITWLLKWVIFGAIVYAIAPGLARASTEYATPVFLGVWFLFVLFLIRSYRKKCEAVRKDQAPTLLLNERYCAEAVRAGLTPEALTLVDKYPHDNLLSYASVDDAESNYLFESIGEDYSERASRLKELLFKHYR